MMYESPINTINAATSLITQQMNDNLDDAIYKTVVEVGINVDKDELLKALNYDRGQYEKGFWDGRLSAQAQLIRCEHCKHWSRNADPWASREGQCWCHDTLTYENDFCNYGEREE